MILVNSVNGTPIKLTRERWNHIIKRHPELEDQKEKVLETLRQPDFVQEGDFESFLAIKFYKETPLTTKFLVVIYKEVAGKDGFILTAYFTNKPSERKKTIWKT